MRQRRLILGLMCAVVLLAGAVAYQASLLHRRAVEARNDASGPRITGMSAGSPVEVKLFHTHPPLEPGLPATDNLLAHFEWKQLESTDYKAYIQNLRGIGCPEETIRDIVLADIERLFGGRRAALLTGGKTPEFWKLSERQLENANSDTQEQLAALDREKIETIRTLLGIDPTTERRKREDGVTYPENRLGNLSPEK